VENEPIKWNELTQRERDTLVAEKVMGWVVTGEFGYPNRNDGNIGSLTQKIPHYTTSIADAWQVVEKMHQTHMVAIFADKEYTVHMIPKVTIRCFNEAITSTAPEAICIAALRAVGCEVVTE
jgi:hypothetical protein